jgi:hypothetical protein
MAGTSFTDIFDLFMMLQSDYQLQALYQTSITDFNNYLEGWLVFAIGDFTVCNQSLIYNSTTQTFTQTLNQENKNILAQMMVKYWMQKQVQNVLQMDNLIQDHDFKTYSQAQNLKAKQDYYNSKKEEISQLMVDYGLRHNNWSQWKNQLFDGG